MTVNQSCESAEDKENRPNKFTNLWRFLAQTVKRLVLVLKLYELLTNQDEVED